MIWGGTGRSEQTGQEQTGQEQIGQEQTGQEQTGQEQIGQEQIGQEQTGQEQRDRWLQTVCQEYRSKRRQVSGTRRQVGERTVPGGM